MEKRLLEILKNQLTVAQGVAIELRIENPEHQELLDQVSELKDKVAALSTSEEVGSKLACKVGDLAKETK